MILFVVNDRWNIKPKSATLRLMWECLQRGHDVGVTDVFNLSISSHQQLTANTIQLPHERYAEFSRKRLQNRIPQIKPSSVSLDDAALIWVRTSPGRDLMNGWAHQTTLSILDVAHRNGCRVINTPSGLHKASSKFYTVTLPEAYVPKTYICHSITDVKKAAQDFGQPFVIKPLLGSQGRDVFFLENIEALNINQIADILGRTGYMVLQEFLPEASEGDIRVLTAGDRLLGMSAEGQAFGIQRTPQKGEFRSNVALGATVSVRALTHIQTDMCLDVAQHLKRDGLELTGIDLIGNKIVEVNVFSPGGYQDLADLTEQNIISQILDTAL